MNKLVTLICASAFVLSYANADEMPHMNQERVQVESEMKKMGTDDLLEKRGTMKTQQEREALHNELMNRQQSMTKEQNEKFMKKPENRTPKMKNQGQGKGMMQGQGKGMMQGQRNGMQGEGMGSGMGGGMMGGGNR